MSYVLITLLALPLLVRAFNLAPDHLVEIADPTGTSDSYFGYQVELLAGTPPMLVVGAPRSVLPNYESMNTQRPGGVYLCSVNNSEPCSQILPGNPSDFPELRDTSSVFLGASLDVGQKDGFLVACAPRWNNLPNVTSREDCLLGLCYFLKNARNQQEVTRLVLHPGGLATVSRRHMIHRQAGMSVRLVQNSHELLIGGVGMHRGNGGLLRVPKETVDDHLVLESPYKNDSKVTDSYFGYSVSSGSFFTGKGTSYVAGAPRADYKGKVFVMTSSGRMEQVLEGPQLGEYFGAALGVVDLNMDGFDDLLVGAPLHSESSADEGMVYVYMSSGKVGRLKQQLVISGRQAAGARFGTCISALGDMDNDGYQDIAVGAPYESDGRGAVYIYHGAADGLNKNFRQRLTSSLKGFGASVSRGVDIDGNSFNDIAVGAYISGKVAVIRSYPVITVLAKVSANVSKLEPNTTTITVTCCFSYGRTKGITGNEQPIELLAKLVIDRAYRRAKLSSDSWRQTFLAEIPGPEKKSCFYFQVQIQPPRGLNYDAKPIDISVTASAILQPRDTFCSNCPIVDPDRPITGKLVLPVDLLCANKSRCEPDLVLEACFVDVTPPLVIGSQNFVQLNARVRNLQEPAYHAQLCVSVPKGCRVSKLPFICQLEKANVTCLVDRPLLPGDQDETVDQVLDVSGLTASMSDLKVLVTVYSLGVEKNELDNEWLLRLPLKTDIDVLMAGESDPPKILFLPQETSDDGEVVRHEYRIENLGRTTATDVVIEVRIPTAICLDHKYEQVLILKYIETSTMSRGFLCNVSVTEHTRDCPSDPSRKTSADVDLSCGMLDVLCSTVLCPVGSLPTVQEVFTELEFVPRLGYLRKALKRNKVVIKSEATTKMMNFEEWPDGRVEGQASVRTELQWSQEEEYPLWMLVGAAMAGLLVLALIVLTLWKCGFFKRNKLAPMEMGKLLPADDESNKQGS